MSEPVPGSFLMVAVARSRPLTQLSSEGRLSWMYHLDVLASESEAFFRKVQPGMKQRLNEAFWNVKSSSLPPERS